MADHDHCSETTYAVSNKPHQHAFVIVGRHTWFGVHMTQYHCELHKYQIILKFKPSDPDAQRQLTELQSKYDADTLVLCNGKDPDRPGQIAEFSIPELAAGRVKSFKGNVFVGLRPPTAEDMRREHFFPWSADRARPAIAGVDIEVERIVLFRPFAHHHRRPDVGTYWLFGEGKEAHMTNLQTAALATSAFEPPAFGPDYDHVMSLKEMPCWLDPVMLEAGIEITIPKVRLRDEAGAPVIPCAEWLFKEGESIEVLYRGINAIPGLRVTAGLTYLQCAAVCNGPPGSVSTAKVMPDCKNDCWFSLMPKYYWVYQQPVSCTS